MKLKENDLGDRMALGLPANTFGAVNPGVGIFSSPEASQNPSNFFPTGKNTPQDINTRLPDPVTPDDINKLKSSVTPDEILCGMEYELKRMVQANKEQAKAIVVNNLKSDPKYYSKLHMMTMGDERVNESVEDKEKEKKKAFEDIFSGISEKRRILSNRAVDSRVVDVYKETLEKRKQKYLK